MSNEIKGVYIALEAVYTDSVGEHQLKVRITERQLQTIVVMLGKIDPRVLLEEEKIDSNSDIVRYYDAELVLRKLNQLNKLINGEDNVRTSVQRTGQLDKGKPNSVQEKRRSNANRAKGVSGPNIRWVKH